MKKILLALLTITNLSTFAKEAKTNVDSTKKTVSPSIAMAVQAESGSVSQPSPDASALGRYGEYEVDLSNGLVPIQIPIYTIESGKLNLPISLSFHSAGIKVNDIATTVGIGWSTIAGGVITRTMVGKSDESNNGYLNTDFPSKANENAINNDFVCFIGGIAALDGIDRDASPDLFFYNFNGNSGRFQIARRDSSRNAITPVFVTVPYKPLKITYTIPSNEANIINFTITDTDGTKYYFGKVVGSTNAYTETTQGNPVYISSWYLNKIESATSNDKIEFTYTAPVRLYKKNIFSTSLTRTEQILTIPISPTFKYSRPQPDANPDVIYPNEIVFKNGKVKFEYIADRQDLVLAADNPASRLNKITISKKTGIDTYAELKHFNLNQSYFSTIDGYSMADGGQQTITHLASNPLRKILKLDKVTEVAPNNDELPPYEIKYNTTDSMSLYAGLGQDYWGYFNGKNANRSRLLTLDTDVSAVFNTGETYNSAELSTLFGVDRLPDFKFTNSGNISEIIYPTGGKTKFIFEPNSHTDGTIGGGVRIKEIESYSSKNATNFVKKTKYSYPSGYFTNPSTYSNLATAGFNYRSEVSLGSSSPQPECKTYRINFITENVNYMLGSGGSNIAYAKVVVSDTDSGNNTNGKAIKTFTTEADLYETLTKIDNNTLVNVERNAFYALPAISRAWKRGQLLTEEYYNSSNNLLKKIVNTYQDYLTDSISVAYIAKVLFQPDVTGSNACIGAYSATQGVGVCPSGANYQQSSSRHLYEFKRLDTEIGYRKLVNSVITNYDENGKNGIKTAIANVYSPNHNRQQLTSRTMNDSQGRSLITNYQYPNDFPLNTALTSMVASNIIDPVIKQTVTRAGISVSESLKNYAYYSGYPQVESVELKIGSGLARTMVSYTDYDASGNPLGMTLLNGSKVDLTWFGATDYGKSDLLKSYQLGGIGSTLLIQKYTLDYEPLVGLKTITDLNSNTITNIYDKHNRLETVKDPLNYILKDMRYQFASQTQQTGLAGTPTATVNFTATRIPRTEQTSISTDETNTINNYAYSDGLGRSLQSLIWKGSPDKTKDLLTNTSFYDAYSRNNKMVLPSPSDSSAGKYRSYASTLASTFYTDSSPISESIYEASPLSRTKQQFGPGVAWRGSTPKPQSIVYYTTGGSDVPLYSVSGNSIVKGTANYPDSSLFKIEITDEQGNKTIEIKDTEGNVIQKRIQDNTGFMTTHYIYNELNQLKAVIQPKAYPLTADLASTADNLFFYDYDQYGRLIEKKTPSAGLESMVYDKWDRLVYTQNALQRRSDQNKWVFYKYDALNRLAYSGIETSTSTRATLQANATASTLARYEVRNTTDTSYSLASSYPVVAYANIKTINFYDNYTGWLPTDLTFSSTNAYHTQETNVLSMQTGEKSRKTYNANWKASAVYYDYKGRTIQAFTQNYFGRTDRSDVQYNFADEVLQVRNQYNYKINGITNETTKTLAKLDLDHLGRPTKVVYGNFVNASASARKARTLADPTLATIANYEYDDIGRMITKTFVPSNTSLVCKVVALPLELLEFKAEALADTAKITWQVANEIAFSRYELQKSENGTQFSPLASIKGNKLEYYFYLDKPPHKSNLAYYRLKLIDENEEYSFSKIVAVPFDGKGTYLKIENPVQNGAIEVTTNLQNPAFELTNAIGQKISINTIAREQNKFLIQAKNTPIGIYYLKATNNDTSIVHKLIIK